MVTTARGPIPTLGAGRNRSSDAGLGELSRASPVPRGTSTISNPARIQIAQSLQTPLRLAERARNHSCRVSYAITAQLGPRTMALGFFPSTCSALDSTWQSMIPRGIETERACWSHVSGAKTALADNTVNFVSLRDFSPLTTFSFHVESDHRARITRPGAVPTDAKPRSRNAARRSRGSMSTIGHGRIAATTRPGSPPPLPTSTHSVDASMGSTTSAQATHCRAS